MKWITRHSKSLLPALAFVLTAIGANAQTQEALALYKAKYPGHHVVQLQDKKITRIKMVKGIPVVSYVETSEYLVLDKNGGIGVFEGSVDFSSFETIKDIEAYSLVPNGKGSKKIPASNFETKTATSGSVFHDDSKSTSFMYTGITEGSLRYLSYETVMNNDYFPFGFSFYNGIPCENSTFIIEADTAVHLMLRSFNAENFNLKVTDVVEKGKRIITYTTGESLIIKSEESGVNPRYYAPHVLGQIAWYSTRQGPVRVTGNITDLHDRYKPNIREVIDEIPAGNLAQIADSITRGIPDEFEKVKAVYYWVQDHIKYIAFEEGVGGFIPRQPSKVIDKRYGDCKDMASLIYSMLKSVNITSYLTWIGSRDLPYKYSEFPSSFCDNHMIATYKHNGKNYYLDATNSFQGIAYPTSFIQGKEAFLHLSDTEFEIATVPVVPALDNQFVDSSFVKINNTKISGKSSITNTGYYNDQVGNFLKTVHPKDYKNLMSNIYERGNNSFSASNPKVFNGSNRDSAITATFDWEVSNYVTKLEDQLFVNMILQKNFVANDAFKETRIVPLEHELEYSDTYYVELAVPEGYKVKYIPKNREFKNDDLSFTVDYTENQGKVIMKLNFTGLFLYMKPDRFADWNKFISIKNAALSETVVLIKQ